MRTRINQNSVVPSCPGLWLFKLLFNKDLCFLMIEFACRSGIDLSHYEIIFVDKDDRKTDVYTMTLDKLQQLIESGYKHGSKYVPLGEYPNSPSLQRKLHHALPSSG